MARQSLAKRRHDERVKKARRSRRAERRLAETPEGMVRLGEGVYVPKAGPQRYDVTLPLSTPEGVRQLVRDSTLNGLKRVVNLEVRVKETDDGIEVRILGVRARGPSNAIEKAMYYCGRAAKVAGLNWTSRMTAGATAERVDG